MKKYKLILMFLIFFVSLIPYNICVNSKVKNQEKFFIRVSEKYDQEIKLQWENSIEERKQILEYIKSNNRYEEYIKYMDKNKNSDLSRLRKKYIKKLIYNIENCNENKIKRYLKLILNIFNEENYKLKQYFDL